MQKRVKKGKTQKSTNNPMSIFGLIEEKMELSISYSFSCNNLIFFSDLDDSLICLLEIGRNLLKLGHLLLLFFHGKETT
jgi:hypothetical protein